MKPPNALNWRVARDNAYFGPDSEAVLWRQTVGKSFRLLWPNIQIGFLYLVAHLIGRLLGRRGNRSAHMSGSTLLAIEAGEVAWSHIFFQELDASAREFLGENRVVRLSVRKDGDYVRQVKQLLCQFSVTHYWYDPRTGTGSHFGGIIEAFRLLAVFVSRGVTPIAYCTDISVRNQRIRAAIITAVSGVCVSLSPPETVRRFFPHNRLVGPALMPLSRSTLASLAGKAQSRAAKSPLRVAFFGSLYEPRTTQLLQIKELLASRGVEFDIRGRRPGGPRMEIEDYWNDLVNTDIVVSTSSQVRSRGMDLSEENHLIYRFTEALASGACLVAERAPGVEGYFQDGRHLFLWDTPEEAARLVAELVSNPPTVQEVKSEGQRCITGLVESGDFWLRINSVLVASPLLAPVTT